MSAVGAVTSGMRRSASARSLKAALSPATQSGLSRHYHISCGCVPGFSANLEIKGKLEKSFTLFFQSRKNQGIKKKIPKIREKSGNLIGPRDKVASVL